MGFGEKRVHPDLKQIKILGQQFETVRHMLNDFRVLTNRAYLQRLLEDLEHIRRNLIEINGATEIDDGSLIIKTECLVPFLSPTGDSRLVFANRPLNLSDPEVIRRVALECSMNQWEFLAKRLPTQEDRDRFIKICLDELRKYRDSSGDF